MKTNFVSLRSVTVVDDEVTLTGTIVLHYDQINFCETVEMFCTYQDFKTLLINESTLFSKVFLRIVQEECDVYDLTTKKFDLLEILPNEWELQKQLSVCCFDKLDDVYQFAIKV